VGIQTQMMTALSPLLELLLLSALLFEDEIDVVVFDVGYYRYC